MALTVIKSQTELKEEVGRMLHVFGVGESALETEDSTVIGDRMTEVLMELSREGLIMFDVTDVTAVDIASFRSIAEIIAASLVSVYEVPTQEANRIFLQADAARSRLKRMIFDGVTDTTVTPDYF